MRNITSKTSPEALNLAEEILDTIQERLLERSIKTSTLKPIVKEGELASETGSQHTIIRAVGTNEIKRIIANLREEIKCEAEEAYVSARKVTRPWGKKKERRK